MIHQSSCFCFLRENPKKNSTDYVGPRGSHREVFFWFSRGFCLSWSKTKKKTTRLHTPTLCHYSCLGVCNLDFGIFWFSKICLLFFVFGLAYLEMVVDWPPVLHFYSLLTPMLPVAAGPYPVHPMVPPLPGGWERDEVAKDFLVFTMLSSSVGVLVMMGYDTQPNLPNLLNWLQNC